MMWHKIYPGQTKSESSGVGWSKSSGNIRARVTMLKNSMGTYTINGEIVFFRAGKKTVTQTKNYMKIVKPKRILWKKRRIVAAKNEAYAIAESFVRFCDEEVGYPGGRA